MQKSLTWVKKLNLFFLSLIIVCSFLSSCSKQKDSSSLNNQTVLIDSPVQTGDTYINDSFIEPGDFFTPDYTPYEAENTSKEKATSSKKTTNNTKKVSSTNAVPGLRDITKYQTTYITDISTTNTQSSGTNISSSNSANIDTSKINNSENELRVVDWGPQGVIPSEVKNPSFYVLFSEPVVSIEALGEQSSYSSYMDINPPLQGIFRWYGTKLLSFDATEMANPLEAYTINVNKNIKSINGTQITGETSFTTEAAPLKIKWSKVGFNYTKEFKQYVDEDNVPPEATKDVRVQFNYPVIASNIQELSNITISTNGKKSNKVKFTVTQDSIDTVTFNIPETLAYNSIVTISVAQPNKSGEPTTMSFHTLTDFKFDSYRDGYTSGKYTNPVYIDFSHPINKDSALKSITTNPDLGINENNINVSGNRITIYGLPVTFKSTYDIIINKNLLDAYGRKLGTTKTITVVVPNAASSVVFPNSGIKMLESQFPHKLVFEYQNILQNSVYTVQNTTTPLTDTNWNNSYNPQQNENKISLSTEPKNQRIFEVVDFDSLLKNGKGIIRFDAEVWLPSSKKNYDITNTTTIQVTDIGVTVRYGINKVVAMVSSLSTGKPIEGCNVYLYNAKNNSVTDVLEGQYIAKGFSDKNGLAVLDLEPSVAVQFFSSGYSTVTKAILAEKNEDIVTFEANSHRTWASGIYSIGSIGAALNEYQRTFMFSDRGLYKPGETVTFRGIDRNQVLGSFIPYTGSYTVSLEEDNWRNPVIFETQNGNTSSSGGFYGSFKLPEDLEPSSYKITYTREDGKSKNLYITVAYFERLQFQTSIEMPTTQVVVGDTLQGTLSASYLAGGVLSEAPYDYSWFYEPWYFTSSNTVFNGYKFGPVNTSENRTFISNGNGSLNNEGIAKLTVETKSGTIKGTPYRYRVSANVTDPSNQLISTVGSSVVHPASFYIGLSKPEGVTSFAKSGQQLNFNYIISDTEGNPLNNLTVKNKKVTITLSRDQWDLVQQQGIGGNVYTRYEKTTIKDSEKTIDLKTNDKFTVTPSKAGYYTIKLATTDNSNRDVITEYSFYVTGSGAVSWYNEDSESLRLVPDQSQYNPGDTAKILLESTLPSGRYLITVEREGIFTEEIKTFNESVNVIDIPIARNYVPVVYVSISSYSIRTKEPDYEYGTEDLDKPKGYYGATTLYINPMVKAFSIDIKSEKQAYRPGEEATITLTASKGGKPLENAELTLMAVDRGVLDLINYHVPNPIDFFYQISNFPLRVLGGDSRAYLMDPVTYEIKNLQGGDANGEGDKLEERSDFDPTAVFEPVLLTDKNGQVTVSFKLPDTLTTYRVTAFGVDGELLALNESEFMVQNPLNVQQVLPRRLRERDTAEMGVLITNLDSIAQEVIVSLEIISPTEIKAVDGKTVIAGKAFVDGVYKQKVTIQPGDSVPAYFDVGAETAGQVNAIFTIESNILNEKLTCPIIIEKPYIFETFATIGSITGNKTNTKENLVMPSFADNGQGSISITLDATRLGLLGDAVQYVFNYPYGCLEQQSAAILPLVIFNDYIDSFGLEKDSKITDVKELVISYFKNWSKYQHFDGGFGYWSDSSSSNVYVTTRIGHIWALAKKCGYTDDELYINDSLISNYIISARDNKSDKLDSTTIAYINYVLSLMGSPVANYKLENQLLDENATFTSIALTGLSAIETQGETSSIANTAATMLKRYMKPSTQTVDISDPKSSSSYFRFYNIFTEQLALSLQLLTKLNPDDEMNTRLLNTLLRNQQNGYWTNTATTARVLESFYTVIKATNLEETNLTASANLDGTQLVVSSFRGVNSKPTTTEYSFTDSKLQGLPADTAIPLLFTKNGTGNLYFSASLQYAIPEEMQKPRDEGLGVYMMLFDDLNGEEITLPNGKNSVVELESGKVYKVKIRLSSSRDRTYIAMRAPIPSGAVILDSTFVTSPDLSVNQTGTGSYSDDTDDFNGYFYGYDHYMSNQFIYDNEIRFFWDSFAKGETTAEFKFRAVRRGVYPTPSITTECMYEPEVFGRTSGILYTIK